MLKLTSNLTSVTSSIIGKLKAITEENAPTRDQMLRTIALDTVASVKQRIHVEGKNSKGESLGEYTNAYMKKRKENNRGANKQVIFSLTRQMENDFGIVAGNGATGYGLGFKNQLNAQKADWLQNGYANSNVKQHTRIINKKSSKSINKIYDRIGAIEDEIADGRHTPEELLKLNRRLRNAQKSLEKAQGTEVKVKAHSRKGFEGFGRTYDPTDYEIEHMRVVAEQFITDLLNK